MQTNPTNTYKYNRLELVLLTYKENSLMEFQPHRSKGVYIVHSSSFILYNRNVCESQKMKLIQNIVRKKTRIKKPNDNNDGYFNTEGFCNYTTGDRDIILFDFLHINTGEEHLSIPFLLDDPCKEVETFGYLNDGTILNRDDTAKYMEVFQEKERIQHLERMATISYSKDTTLSGVFQNISISSSIENYFGQVATTEEVKKKYIELAKIHHPDMGGDELVFKALSNIKNYLIDKLNEDTKV